jgi:type I restriction enzyme R subunit
VAVCEFQTDTGPADYALFVDGRAVGVVEAKKMEELSSSDDASLAIGESLKRYCLQ